MRTNLFLAAVMAVSTFSCASLASARDVDGPAQGSACDVMSKAFLKDMGGKGDRVKVAISEERDGGVSFVALKAPPFAFPLGELNGMLPRLENQAQAVQASHAQGAWAVAREADGRMKVFYVSSNGCVEAFSN